MATIEETVEVNVPLRTVYNQWTQFEEFPHFMEGVREVRQLDEKRLHWTAEIAGKVKEWDAEILEQIPDEKIVWRSTSGAPNAGVVRFDKTDENRTRVTLVLSFEGESATEKMAGALGLVGGRVRADLKRFKEFIEKRGLESGAWRGEIHEGRKAAGESQLKTAAELAREPRSKRIHE